MSYDLIDFSQIPTVLKINSAAYATFTLYIETQCIKQNASLETCLNLAYKRDFPYMYLSEMFRNSDSVEHGVVRIEKKTDTIKQMKLESEREQLYDASLTMFAETIQTAVGLSIPVIKKLFIYGSLIGRYKETDWYTGYAFITDLVRILNIEK